MDTLTTYEPAELATSEPVAAVLGDWHAWLDLQVDAGQISRDTANTYKRGAAKFFSWLAGRVTDRDTILEWQKHLRENGNKPAAMNAWLGGVRSFFGWATTRSKITFNPAQGIRGAKRSGTKKRHIRESLTDPEVIRLLGKPDRTTPEGARDYALLTIQLYTAARGIELYRADVADLQTQSGYLVLMVQGKGQTEKDEPVVLLGDAAEAVRDWLAFRGFE